MLDELREKYNEQRKKAADLRRALDYNYGLREMKKIEKRMGRPEFWNDQEAAKKYVDRFKDLKRTITPLKDAGAALDDVEVLLELLGEDYSDDLAAEAADELGKLTGKLGHFEFLRMMSGKNDRKDTFIHVQAGAGGTDSCDWADMLIRMYMRYLEEKGFELKLIDKVDNDEGGVKSVTFEVSGSYAYGFMKSEIGVHRLVRLSPYDYNERRHTSFASVDVVPVFEEGIDIQINESDLRVDTFRSSGAGGQHVNVTDSAVRLTHLPTGIVVTCQNERSQHHNKTMAMKLLRAKLHRHEEQKREAELKNLYGAKGEIAWGNQIRSYVKHPYSLVKDHRTGVETSNVEAVLDGELDQFIDAYLKKSINKKSGQ